MTAGRPSIGAGAVRDTAVTETQGLPARSTRMRTTALLIALATTAASAAAQVIPTEELPIEAAASPEGRNFAFAGAWAAWGRGEVIDPRMHAVNYHVEVWRMRLPGGAPERILRLERARGIPRPEIDPDGTVAVVIDRRIHRIGPDGTAMACDLPENHTVAAWSPSWLLSSPYRSAGGGQDGMPLFRFRLGPEGLGPAEKIEARHEELGRGHRRSGHFFFAGSHARFFDAATGRFRDLFDASTSVFHVEGRWLFAGQEEMALLVDLESDRRLRCPAPGRVIHFSPTGIVFAGPTGACLWDPVAGTRRHFRFDGGSLARIPWGDGAFRFAWAGRERPSGRIFVADPGAATRPFEASDFCVPAPDFPELVERLGGSGDVNERCMAARDLGFRFGEAARKALLSALEKEESTSVAGTGILWALRFAALSEDVPAIHAAAGRAGVLNEAARTLAILGDPRSLPWLGKRRERIPHSRHSDSPGVAADVIARLEERPGFNAALASFR